MKLQENENIFKTFLKKLQDLLIVKLCRAENDFPIVVRCFKYTTIHTSTPDKSTKKCYFQHASFLSQRNSTLERLRMKFKFIILKFKIFYSMVPNSFLKWPSKIILIARIL